jgi:mRNA-degrading endonuclease RelE of RelBE toxin-antitoxin system
MSEDAPERTAITWSPAARADVRAIERNAATQILGCIDDYITRRVGAVKALWPPLTGFRLRCGNYRVFFDQTGPNAIEITKVKDRKDAYR